MLKKENTEIKKEFVFWGTSLFSVGVLEALKKSGFLPDIVVTAPDKPKGRKLIITPPPVKIWAEQNDIPILQPEVLDDAFSYQLKADSWKLFLVASYGKIIPKIILDIPKHGTLNVHPSLLPKLRGASPIQGAILEEDGTGVTIMLVDDQMDHGPIVAQRKVPITPWPPKASELENKLAYEGGKLLAETIPDWVLGKIEPREQEHEKATYTKKITKEGGLIDLSGDQGMNFRKIRAFDVWPRAYFFAERHGHKIRVTVIDAELIDLPAPSNARQAGGKLIIKKVLPEGKKEMRYEDFLRGV